MDILRALEEAAAADAIVQCECCERIVREETMLDGVCSWCWSNGETYYEHIESE